MTLRPFGPSVTLTARASLDTPRRIASRASWSNAICLAAILSPSEIVISRQQVGWAESSRHTGQHAMGDSASRLGGDAWWASKTRPTLHLHRTVIALWFNHR